MLRRLETGVVEHVPRRGQVVVGDEIRQCADRGVHQCSHAVLGVGERLGRLAAMHATHLLAAHGRHPALSTVTDSSMALAHGVDDTHGVRTRGLRWVPACGAGLGEQHEALPIGQQMQAPVVLEQVVRGFELDGRGVHRYEQFGQVRHARGTRMSGAWPSSSQARQYRLFAGGLV